MDAYRTPGVYIEEISKFPPSVVPVETAIPAFIGYTELTQHIGEDLVNNPVKVSSLLEYEQIFGLPPSIGTGLAITTNADGEVSSVIPDPNLNTLASNRMANAVKYYFLNSGGPCYIISIGAYGADATASDIVDSHLDGLDALSREDEPTLIIMPDLSGMSDGTNVDEVSPQYHSVLVQALNQCATLGDRFLICDLIDGDQDGEPNIGAFRDAIGTVNLKYGAVYHPFIHTTLPWRWDETSILVNGTPLEEFDGGHPTSNPTIYGNVKTELDRFSVVLPPACAAAGVYAAVDRTRGVWKSPANISLAGVRNLTVKIDNDLNDFMNVHSTGKSINAIRFYSGRGNLVWGARTLAGNDNEWRYVSVRRFFNMVEESTKKASQHFVFEPNDSNTWVKVRTMIENFLTLQWRAGALVGAKPEHAFYVRVGLGTTMTAQDVLEGRMNIEIGMAVVRPAEFIILQFSHKMQES